MATQKNLQMRSILTHVTNTAFKDFFFYDRVGSIGTNRTFRLNTMAARLSRCQPTQRDPSKQHWHSSVVQLSPVSEHTQANDQQCVAPKASSYGVAVENLENNFIHDQGHRG